MKCIKEQRIALAKRRLVPKYRASISELLWSHVPVQRITTASAHTDSRAKHEGGSGQISMHTIVAFTAKDDYKCPEPAQSGKITCDENVWNNVTHSSNVRPSICFTISTHCLRGTYRKFRRFPRHLRMDMCCALAPRFPDGPPSRRLLYRSIPFLPPCPPRQLPPSSMEVAKYILNREKSSANSETLG